MQALVAMSESIWNGYLQVTPGRGLRSSACPEHDAFFCSDGDVGCTTNNTNSAWRFPGVP